MKVTQFDFLSGAEEIECHSFFEENAVNFGHWHLAWKAVSLKITNISKTKIFLPV